MTDADATTAEVDSLEWQVAGMRRSLNAFRRGTMVTDDGRLMHALHEDGGAKFAPPYTQFRGGRSALPMDDMEAGARLFRVTSEASRIARSFRSIPLQTFAIPPTDPFAPGQVAVGRAFLIGFLAIDGLEVHWTGSEWLVTGAKWEMPDGKIAVIEPQTLDGATGIIVLEVAASYPDLLNVLTRPSSEVLESDGIAVLGIRIRLQPVEPAISMSGVGSYAFKESQRAHLTTRPSGDGESFDSPDEDFSQRSSIEPFPVAMVIAPSRDTENAPIIFPLAGRDASIVTKPYFGQTSRKEPFNP